MRSRKALLYVPGNDAKKIHKAATAGADSVCLDLEDSVALNRKSEARQTIVSALLSMNFGNSERLVRINSIGSGFEEEDLAVVLPALPDGIVIPKVESAAQIQWVWERIEKYFTAHTFIDTKPSHPPGLVALVETARGIANLSEISTAQPSLEALIFGAEDLASNIGATRTKAGWEVFFARSAVVLHASAQGLQAIDMVFVELADLEGLKAESQQGAQMGFVGKQIIHPIQIEPVHVAFVPSDDAIAHAKCIVETYQQQQQAGIGVFELNGKMIDAPIVKAATSLLARAQASGKFNPDE